MPPLSNSISTIPVNIFNDYIVEKLRRDNPHLRFAVDESRHVLGGSVVHIPQAGASPDVVRNRKVFPATAVQRADSMVTYALDVYTTDPTHITWHEGAEISYEKTDSVLNDHVATLVELIGDRMLYNWIVGLKGAVGNYTEDKLPAASIIRTSGAATAVNGVDGQTGTRKAFSYKELQQAQALMNKHSVSKLGRVALLESYMHQQFIESLSANQMAAYQQSADLANGIVGRFAGFSILERSSTLAFAADGTTPIDPSVALDADSNLAALCWQQDCVTTSTGDIVNFETLKDPTYYGDIFSALVKFGGRAKREDWKGIIAIVQE